MTESEKHTNITELTHIIVICMLGAIAYHNTLGVPFTLDDFSNIVECKEIRNLNDFISLKLLTHGEYGFRARFVGYFTFALNYWFSGLNVRSYHVVNILIHIINAFLIYRMILLIPKTPFFADFTKHQSIRTLAFLASAFFVVHPVQTQSVTYLVQRFEALATTFYLVSIIFFIKLGTSSGRTRIFYFITCFISTALSMKTKEVALTIPMMMLMMEFLFFTPVKRKNRLIVLLPILLLILLIPLAVVHGDIKQLPNSYNIVNNDMSTFQRVDDEDMSGSQRVDDENASNAPSSNRKVKAVKSSHYTYTISQFAVMLTYLRILFFPLHQNLDYDYPMYISFLRFKVLAGALTVMAIISIAVYFIYRSGKHNGTAKYYQRLFSLGVIWYFITLLVQSGLVSIADLIFEHRLYLPSIGFFIALFALLELFMINKPIFSKIRKEALFAVPIVILCILTIQRNKVWQSNITLWEDTAKKSPNKWRCGFLLSKAYADAGRIDDAIAELRRTIMVAPLRHQSYNNLANLYMATRQYDKSLIIFEQLVQIKPWSPEVHNNLGVAYLLTNQNENAIEEFKKALQIKSDYVAAYNNLAIAYHNLKKDKHAQVITERAISVNKDTAEPDENIQVLKNNLQMIKPNDNTTTR
ncbi:MAG: tetratricopeptide repeat protein [Nitrospirae bacterium]|nr:tetratricopeptide repeat protein [Nitrospirota bacterium]